jgi:hypothetical protein
MKIDLSALEKAIASLDVAIKRSIKEKNDELIRDGVIQRFEYTFELCIKMLKRILENISAIPSQVDTYSYQQLLREAAEKGIITNVDQWILYRYQRNITSHTYNQEKAISVYETVLSFIVDAKILYANLEKFNHD